MSREYEADKYLKIFGTTVMAAVLLLLVAATGYFLFEDNGWSSDKMVLTCGALALLVIAFLIAMLTAHGSQQQPARTIAAEVPLPAPLSVIPLQPVHEATYIDGLHDVRLPLGEAFDLLV